MKTLAPNKNTKKKLLKLDEKAHEAQAKADKLQRKALDNGDKTKKAEKAQDKADQKAEKAMFTVGSE